MYDPRNRPSLLEGEKTTKTKYFIYIDKRIAFLELLTERHKLRSQFLLALVQIRCVVREFVSKTFFCFCYSQSSNKYNL